MKISIMQPGYLPWLGFFELMARCDLFVILDNVQFTKKDWRSRNRIRTKDGWIWLSVPVLSKHRKTQLITETKINNDRHWGQDHLQSLKIHYAKAPYLKDYIPFFEDIYNRKWDYLLDLDMAIIVHLAEQLNISTTIIQASNLPIPEVSGNQRILEICRVTRAHELYDSNGAIAFINTALFHEAGINLTFQDYPHPEYRQIYKPFLAYMSVIDLLFNEGPQSKEIILNSPILKSKE